MEAEFIGFFKEKAKQPSKRSVSEILMFLVKKNCWTGKSYVLLSPLAVTYDHLYRGLGIAAICSALGIRLIASFLAVTPSRLTYKERVFVALAWMPKATVQAAIGPLALDAARKTGDPYLIDLGEQVRSG
ncbi:unnamed protein product [Dibothriocephalus latus]|uniref:Uncharacterized protein n=1 Tax=Dibothriocephalus latus TaxID=60516 RepID=A0A3P7NVB3_DIBLA|nr:unnamed protein product [Dibothriocephalus latus]